MVANASAKNAYQKYLEILRGDCWQKLSRHGAQIRCAEENYQPAATMFSSCGLTVSGGRV